MNRNSTWLDWVVLIATAFFGVLAFIFGIFLAVGLYALGIIIRLLIVLGPPLIMAATALLIFYIAFDAELPAWLM